MPKVKLYRNQVKEIYTKFILGEADEFELGREYNVKPDTVRDIVYGRSWRGLNLDSAEILSERHKLITGAEAMLNEGHSMFEVAVLLNITPHELSDLLEEVDIETKEV